MVVPPEIQAGADDAFSSAVAKAVIAQAVLMICEDLGASPEVIKAREQQLARALDRAERAGDLSDALDEAYPEGPTVN